jgi:putative ABC transport system substrate-binding protein
MILETMRRREFLGLVGGAAACPVAASAQQQGKPWRIGFLTTQAPSTFLGLLSGFVQGMGELGYVQGKHFTADWRTTDGDYDRLPQVAAEMIRDQFDVLASGIGRVVRVLQQATHSIPIVMIGLTDPVGLGVVASLSKPGGNTTGTASSADDTIPKQLELIAQLVLQPSRFGCLINPNGLSASAVIAAAQTAAARVGWSILPMPAGSEPEIVSSFNAAAAAGVQAVMIMADPLFTENVVQIAESAMKHRLPAIFPQSDFPKAGGLMSYGEDRSEFYRRAASFVHKIMLGTHPKDLPIEQPTRFHLTINRKIADALGLTIPPLLYIFADEVIE